jgi:hypothetical protein
LIVAKKEFENIFVLNTGRCGSTTFAKACKHIINYTSAHESQSSLIGDSRLNYPPSHIEVDNNLSWMLGSLDERYGNEAFYVHLEREKGKVVASCNQLWGHSFNNLKFFTGLLGNVPELLSDSNKLTVTTQFIDGITSSINLFLRDKTNMVRVDIDDPKKTFTEFWQLIEAEGDLEKALSEFDVRHNENLTSPETTRADQAFQREIREKIFNKRISEATSRSERLNLKFGLALFKLTGLCSENS